MKRIFYLHLLFCLAYLSSCQNNAPSNTNEEVQDSIIIETPQEVEVFDSRKAIFLQSLYATSSSPNHDINLILDNDTSTHWKTRLGAGPDEGIMLNFFSDTENYIERLEIEFPEEEQLAQISDMTVYVNGQPLLFFNGNESVEIDTFVNTLFIRIGGTEEINFKEGDDNGLYLSTYQFSQNHSVGISSLKLYGREGEEYKVVAPKVVKGTVVPSSNLNPMVAYHAGLLFDGRKEFAWVEGAEGSGREDSILFQVEAPLNISEIQLWNGYQRSPLHYKSNARIKQFSFGLLGEVPVVYDLEDEMEPQSIRLGKRLEGQSFVLKILDIYPGRSYSDMALSEILFFDGDQPMVIESDLTKQFQEEYISQSQGTLLGNLLDRRIYSEAEVEPELFQNQSLILRSDGTFVCYLREYSVETDEDSQTFADGNWQILEIMENYARVKIFGKMTNLSDLEAYYLGVSQGEFSRIFNDALDIHPDKINSDRFLGTFYVE